MKCLITLLGVSFLLIQLASAAHEQSVLARVTVYWRSEGSGERASSNGCRLREGHCAVDPKKIPFGSRVVFDDISCVAVDSGRDVISRKAARLSGRNAAERNALVIDRYFETKTNAMVWAASHPHFMNIRIVPAGSLSPQKPGWRLAVTDQKRTVAGSRPAAARQNQAAVTSAANTAPWYIARRKS